MSRAVSARLRASSTKPGDTSTFLRGVLTRSRVIFTMRRGNSTVRSASLTISRALITSFRRKAAMAEVVATGYGAGAVRSILLMVN